MPANVIITTNDGTLATLTATFKNDAGTLTDPTTVTAKYKPVNSDTITTVTYAGGGITKTSTGVYTLEIDTTGTAPGITGEMIGTGAVQVTEPFTIVVGALPIPL